MPIVKGSSMMSLGTWKARSTQYQKILNLSNVFMLIVSTILLFTSGLLISFYHLTKLDFWSWYFYACPVCMLVLGLYTFAVSVYGFLISNQESRVLISLIAIFFSIAFFIQIFSIFTAVELRNKIKSEKIPITYLNNNMRKYTKDDRIKSNWDAMQQDLRCCGGMQFEVGFTDWDTLLDRDEDVPDSCCHEETTNCGKGILTYAQENHNHLNYGIWKDGCMEILQLKLRYKVAPLLMIYSVIGVLLAIVELITVVLACSYIAQISRRKKRDELFTNATHEEYQPSLTSREVNF